MHDLKEKNLATHIDGIGTCDYVRASIAMAVCNGAKYLERQLESVIPMIGTTDEIVISYDVSNDETWDIISAYSDSYSYIRVYRNEGKRGVCPNFENAIRHCRGEYIFLCDQDDIWLGNKLDEVIECFVLTNADMVIHNGYLVDANYEQLGELFNENNATPNPFLNFVKGRYLGCCMAFRANCFSYILPFPNSPADFPHDVFATIVVGLKGKVVTLPEQYYIKHVLHGSNFTPKKHRKIGAVIRDRLVLLKYIVITVVGR